MNEEVKNVVRCTDTHIVSYVVTCAYPETSIFFCVSTRWCDIRSNLAHDTYETRVFVADSEEYRAACINFDDTQRQLPSVYAIRLDSPHKAQEQHDEVCNMLSLGELTLKIE